MNVSEQTASVAATNSAVTSKTIALDGATSGPKQEDGQPNIETVSETSLQPTMTVNQLAAGPQMDETCCRLELPYDLEAAESGAGAEHVLTPAGIRQQDAISPIPTSYTADDQQQQQQQPLGGSLVNNYASKNTNDSSHSDDQSSVSRYRPQKYCAVCGDKAIACNFNAVTCESCKAFFRRNAFKEQRLKCLFDSSCVIDKVTRRFCSKCRLLKCLSIGMKREWILTDEQKQVKRVKILQNKQSKQRQQQSQQVSTSSPTNSEANSGCPVSQHELRIEQTDQLIKRRREHSPAAFARESRTVAVEKRDASTSCPDEADLITGQLLPYCSFAHQCHFCSARIQSATESNSPNLSHNHSLHHHYHLSASQNSQQQQQQQQEPFHFEQHRYAGVYANTMPGEQLLVHTAECCCHTSLGEAFQQCQSSSRPAASNSQQQQQQQAEPPPVISHFPLAADLHTMEPKEASAAILLISAPGKTTMNPFERAIDAQLHSLAISANQTRDTNNNNNGNNNHTESESVESIKCSSGRKSSANESDKEEPCKLDQCMPIDQSKYIVWDGVLYAQPAIAESEIHERVQNINFTESERQLVYEMIDAIRFMFEPTTVDRSFNEEALNDFVYFCDAALRRLIKTVKQIRAFRILSMDDQIMLLKTACFKILLLRSCIHYHDDIEGWRDRHGRVMPLSMLKKAKSLVYDKHKEILTKLSGPLRKDRMIMGFMSLVLLFEPQDSLRHNKSVGLDNLIYLCILRKYLIGTQPDPLEKYERLVEATQVINACNEEYNVFFSRNFQPEQITPLLIEIFDISINNSV